MEKLALLVHTMLLFNVFVNGIASEACPKQSDIAPCTCKALAAEVSIKCNGMQSVQELKAVLLGIKGRDIGNLEVENSYLGDVPGNLFKGMNIRILKFSFSKMTSLGDDQDPPFSGLENSLMKLKITEGFWDYEKPLTKPIKLEHLKKLKLLALENNVIPKMGKDWFGRGPENLRYLSIQTCLVKEVEDGTFAGLKNLLSFHFTGNSVTLPRSALPAIMPRLISLDLRENQIVKLQNDFFTGFPSLKKVSLDYNALESLPEATWKNIIRQLHKLFVRSNPMVCDSKLKWITSPDIKEGVIFGECAQPQSLNGRQLGTLKEGELTS